MGKTCSHKFDTEVTLFGGAILDLCTLGSLKCSLCGVHSNKCGCKK